MINYRFLQDTWEIWLKLAFFHTEWNFIKICFRYFFVFSYTKNSSHRWWIFDQFLKFLKTFFIPSIALFVIFSIEPNVIFGEALSNLLSRLWYQRICTQPVLLKVLSTIRWFLASVGSHQQISTLNQLICSNFMKCFWIYRI